MGGGESGRQVWREGKRGLYHTKAKCLGKKNKTRRGVSVKPGKWEVLIGVPATRLPAGAGVG